MQREVGITFLWNNLCQLERDLHHNCKGCKTRVAEKGATTM